jgi:hypothetical protein
MNGSVYNEIYSSKIVRSFATFGLFGGESVHSLSIRYGVGHFLFKKFFLVERRPESDHQTKRRITSSKYFRSL